MNATTREAIDACSLAEQVSITLHNLLTPSEVKNIKKETLPLLDEYIQTETLVDYESLQKFMTSVSKEEVREKIQNEREEKRKQTLIKKKKSKKKPDNDYDDDVPKDRKKRK